MKSERTTFSMTIDLQRMSNIDTQFETNDKTTLYKNQHQTSKSFKQLIEVMIKAYIALKLDVSFQKINNSSVKNIELSSKNSLSN